MGDVERLTGAENLAADDWWAGPEVAPTEAARAPYTDEQGAAAMDALSAAFQALNDLTAETDRLIPDATQWMDDHLAQEDMVATVALIQDLRRRLALVEAYVARKAGQSGGPLKGYLPDGRQYELRKGANRKAWDHDDWKRDVRRKVADEVASRVIIHAHDDAALVDTTTGEDVTLSRVIQEAVTKAQEVHGSTAPRVKSLKALGMDPGDYCETFPGPWGVTVTQATETTTTTTPED